MGISWADWLLTTNSSIDRYWHLSAATVSWPWLKMFLFSCLPMYSLDFLPISFSTLDMLDIDSTFARPLWVPRWSIPDMLLAKSLIFLLFYLPEFVREAQSYGNWRLRYLTSRTMRAWCCWCNLSASSFSLTASYCLSARPLLARPARLRLW